MNNHKEYWENNIEGFSGFYDTTSEETLKVNFLFSWLYKKFVFPIEKKYMMLRHQEVSNFIEKNIKNNFHVADIGCGSGIYSKKIANKVGKNGKVFALDFTEASITLVNNNLTIDEKEIVSINQFDIINECIPNVDVAISIGVLPYINDLDKYLNHILPYTKEIYFNFLDSNNILNKIRILFPFLNARNYSYHSYTDIIKILEIKGFSIQTTYDLATGIMIHAKSK